MSDRSYKFGVDFVYQHKDNKRFAPTLNARDYKDPKCVIVPSNDVKPVLKEKPVDYRDRVATVLGGIGEKKSHNGTQYFQQDRIYDGRKTVAVCCSATLSNGSNMYLIEEEFKPKRSIVAMRGRNPKNPSDRTKATEYVQRLEFNKQGICNTLTTVDKDNYVLEVC